MNENRDKNEDGLVFDMFSHEINNQLSSIWGALDLVAMMGLDDRQSQFLQRVEAGLTHLKTTIDGLLYFAKSSGGLELNYSSVDFGNMVERVIDLLSAELSYKDINLELQVESNLGVVRCDETLLMHVIQNLIINAIKYKKGDGVDIMLHVANQGDFVRMDIQDNGIGIHADEINKIFDEYYRVIDNPTQIKGSGLGLAIAKLIVTEHGGRVWAESEVGKGSTFSFTIPHHRNDDPADKIINRHAHTGFGVTRVPAAESMDDVDDNIQESKPRGEDSPLDAF